MIQIFGEIISDLETPSFGFEKKLIIAKNTGLFKKDTKKKVKKDENNIKQKLLDVLPVYMNIKNQIKYKQD